MDAKFDGKILSRAHGTTCHEQEFGKIIFSVHGHSLTYTEFGRATSYNT